MLFRNGSMEIIAKIWPIVVVVLVVFLIKEGLSFYKYLKYCQLHEAAKTGNMNKAKKLIDAGQPVTALDTRFGLTALHFAVRNRQMEIAQLLIENGASLIQPSLQGITALDWATEYLDSHQRKTLLDLAEIDMNIHEQEMSP
jgi:ankyrin repeat protein